MGPTPEEIAEFIRLLRLHPELAPEVRRILNSGTDRKSAQTGRGKE